MAPILTVIGATGKQGSSVVNAALQDGKYKIRAITRDVNSESAKALSSRGVELVTADVNSEQALIRAFEGSAAIFAVTAFAIPFATEGPERAMEIEFEQGRNIANAAAKTSTLKHFIWSTLPSATKISAGKHVVPHFEAKYKIDEYIKSNTALYAKSTFLWVGFYEQNYLAPLFAPNFVKTSRKYVQLQPISPTVPILTLGIPQNLGKFTSAILAQPALTIGKYILAYDAKLPFGRILEIWSEVTKKPALYVQLSSLEGYDDLWPKWGKELGSMLQFWEEYGERGWSGEDILTSKDLGIQDSLTGIRETFQSMDWSAL